MITDLRLGPRKTMTNLVRRMKMMGELNKSKNKSIK